MKHTVDTVRMAFLDYFLEKDHKQIDGSSLIPPAEDPTLLLINSGMAPLKPYFTGAKTPPSTRMCNVQGCIRTVDIEDVGDNTHLTYFDMLGNWSIGDYGREEAVDLAAQLIINRLGMPTEKLYASVYAGNDGICVPFDAQSHAAWQKNGFSADKIVALGDEDNFWGPAGDTGPCGPCTELFIDNGPSKGEDFKTTGVFDTINRYTEIWNAGVFMTLNKNASGALTPLPFESVDSGAGLERMTVALNGLSSVYEVGPYPDLLSIIPGDMQTRDRRIIADHARASAHIMADGVSPGKAGRDYVVRRLLRRMETIAAGYGQPIDYNQLLDVVTAHDGAYKAQLGHNQLISAEIIKSEATSFQKVLKQGARQVERHLRSVPGEVDAKTAFSIVTSVGMPIESLRTLAVFHGACVDEKGFNALMEEHKAISRRPPGSKPS